MERRSCVKLRWKLAQFIFGVVIVFAGSSVYADDCDDQLKEIESQFDSLGKEMGRVLSKLDLNSIESKFFSEPSQQWRLMNSADKKAVFEELKKALGDVGCDITSNLTADKIHNCVSFSAEINDPPALSLGTKFGGFLGFGKNSYRITYSFHHPEPSKRLTIRIMHGKYGLSSISRYMKEEKKCDVIFTKGVDLKYFDILPNPYASDRR